MMPGRLHTRKWREARWHDRTKYPIWVLGGVSGSGPSLGVSAAATWVLAAMVCGVADAIDKKEFDDIANQRAEHEGTRESEKGAIIISFLLQPIEGALIWATD